MPLRSQDAVHITGKFYVHGVCPHPLHGDSGGLGSIAGVIIGALILVFLPEVLREVQLYRMLALGAGLVVLMIFRPQGLLGGKRVSLGS